jgi:threonine dehydrogenase-like Zn-dependent dehydrogenase
MRALTTVPRQASSADVVDVPDPEPQEGDLLVDAIAVGVCGTDQEIARGEYGWAPPGRERLVLGHESLGRVRQAPGGSGFEAGDLVVGVVRRPDPVPCGACAHGEFDMCRNGRYTERGIKQLDGYGATTWSVEPDFAVRLDAQLGITGVLTEPTSVVAKAWEQVERVGSRSAGFAPTRTLVTGAGPVGLLAALLAAQRDQEVHVLDRVEDGPKPALVEALGATYHHDLAEVPEVDVVIESTGVGEVIFGAARLIRPVGVMCLVGLSPAARCLRIDAAGLNQDMVLENAVIVGSVNANLGHYSAAVSALESADRDWLERLITRRVPLASFQDALERRDDDVKVVLDLEVSDG